MSRLRVTIDSGVNHASKNIDTIEFEALGITEEQWDNSTEENQFALVIDYIVYALCNGSNRNQFALVIDYWHSQGVPEVTFEKVED